jgi:hypothetical protein
MRKKTFSRALSITALLSVQVILASCMTGAYLKAEPVREIDISGSYTLILYGADLTRLAILDREGDDYRFEMTESVHSYRIEEGVPAGNAVNQAMAFIYSQRNRWRKITDKNGNTIGYELRPLYNIVHYGSSDILNVNYIVTGSRVQVLIDLKWAVKNKIERDDFGGD